MVSRKQEEVISFMQYLCPRAKRGGMEEIMKKITKLITSTMLLVTLISPTIVSAKELKYSDENFPTDNLTATLTDKQTGETIELKEDIEPIVIRKSSRSNDGSEIYEATYEVFIQFENDKPVSISPRSAESSSKYEAGVKAYATVMYTLNSSETKISVDGISGGWRPDSLYMVSDRRVVLKEARFGKALIKTPSSNTFNYTTNWGYRPYVQGDYGGSFVMDATITVPGMSGTEHLLSFSHNFPK